MKALRKVGTIGFRFLVFCVVVYIVFVSSRYILNEIQFVYNRVSDRNVVFWNDFREYDFFAKTCFDGEHSDWRRSGKVSFDKSGIVLAGNRSYKKCEVQGRQRFLYQSLEFMAQTKSWKPGTTAGFEYWEGNYHSAIKIDDGKLVVIHDPAFHTEKDIPNWDKIKNKTNIYRIDWREDEVRLFVNRKFAIAISSRDIPSRELLIRFNVSEEAKDTLKVAYVKVSQSSPRKFGKLYQVSWNILGGIIRTFVVLFFLIYFIGISIIFFRKKNIQKQ